MIILPNIQFNLWTKCNNHWFESLFELCQLWNVILEWKSTQKLRTDIIIRIKITILNRNQTDFFFYFLIKCRKRLHELSKSFNLTTLILGNHFLFFNFLKFLFGVWCFVQISESRQQIFNDFESLNQCVRLIFEYFCILRWWKRFWLLLTFNRFFLNFLLLIFVWQMLRFLIFYGYGLRS